MATAIVRAYCSDGFVVAADGRKKEQGVKNPRVIDNVQKIFPIGESVAYSLTGSAELGDIREQHLETVLFNFTQQVSENFQAEGLRQHSSLLEFAQQGALKVQKNLMAACENPNIDLINTPFNRQAGGKEIVNILLDGYVNGRPERIRVLFWHDGGVLGAPDVEPQPLELGCWRYGSKIVAEKLMTDRMFFLKHQIENDGLGGRFKGDLPDLIHQAAIFIEASKSDEARRIDPLVSDTVGGHTHILVIPKGQPLEWVISPASTTAP
jgi:hypothetical protein